MYNLLIGMFLFLLISFFGCITVYKLDQIKSMLEAEGRGV